MKNERTTAGEVNRIEQMYSPIRRKQEYSTYQYDENKETVFTDTVYLLTIIYNSLKKTTDLLAAKKDSLSKTLLYYCFLVFRRLGECISLDLFYLHR